MKCELCHKNDAETAINKGEEELYVCKECAKRERVKRQKKSQRTRKVTGLPPGMSMSITEVSSEDVPPPIIEALMGAMDGLVGEIEKRIGEGEGEDEGEGQGQGEEKGEGESEGSERKKKYHTLSCERADSHYRIGSRLHLEGLCLLGELDAVKRAMRALNLQLVGVDADGVHDTGHVYELQYQGSLKRAKRVAEDLMAREESARSHLYNEIPRVFLDSLCRALAILKNCRVLSPGEFFDLLSPLRLAAYQDYLDGITLDEIKTMAESIDITSGEDDMEPEERDAADAARADEVNKLFEDVVLNEKAEGLVS